MGSEQCNKESNLHPHLISEDKLGIEIEIEDTVPRYDLAHWVPIEDGSLRNNGIEYVLKHPLGGASLIEAIEEIDERLLMQVLDGKLDNSWRCSTHIHIDIRGMSVHQLKSLILTYIMYEGLLFKSSGESRQSSNFCPAYSFAQGQLEMLASIWNKSTRGFLCGIRRTWSKYSSLNLLPISRIGSVELRISTGILSKEELIPICNRALLLKWVAVWWGEKPHEDLIHTLFCANPEVFFSGKISSAKVEKNDLAKRLAMATDVINRGRLQASQNQGIDVDIDEEMFCVVTDLPELLLDEEGVVLQNLEVIFSLTESASYSGRLTRDEISLIIAETGLDEGDILLSEEELERYFAIN